MRKACPSLVYANPSEASPAVPPLQPSSQCLVQSMAPTASLALLQALNLLGQGCSLLARVHPGSLGAILVPSCSALHHKDKPVTLLGSWPPAGAGSSADTPRDHWPLWPLLRDFRWIQGSSSEGGDGKGRGIEQGHTWESPEQGHRARSHMGVTRTGFWRF